MITGAYLRRVLDRLGYEVVGIAASGASALEQIERIRPDLLLADVGLKGDMDGVEVAARVLEDWQIPTVFLTAYSDPETHLRAKLTEPYGFLVKPFAEQDLHTAIETALERKALQTRCGDVGQRLAAIHVNLGGVLQDLPAAIRDGKTPELEGLSRRVAELANDLRGVADRLLRSSSLDGRL